ncbi:MULTISPECIES: hypothetical protein [unclassified Enterococcus]|uniref:hypothetical protein n=1 Tax=unclassified Enterococcus TaxID=2608891 RepID=UPI001553914E|nr:MULTISPECIES: hypothetical protein [unclassified Enterococcus]MBS7578468.1 hypothetical protein [Enterococcus sp. MMGLQ5-2]MBS7585701.1 hypothetical protein [Enterococcus sp. MMGLQ5-1]NPD13560.1 hypothetical protein [Enterococcus sp. MMGLQ5-1]NPD38302.1 hypothetical protein [Enterococcus sp. MMGLQ5-2]
MTLAQLSGAVVNDGINGKNNIILSDTAPTNPEDGQLWQDTSSTPEIVRKWEDSTWKTWGLYAPNINVDTLSALAISTGSLTNVYEVNHPTYGKHNGTVKIGDDGFKIEDVATLADGKYKGTKVDITGSTQGTTGIFMQEIPDIAVPTKFKQVWYMGDGVYFTDSINNYVGSVTAEQLTAVPFKTLTLADGMLSDSVDNTAYRKFKQLDGSYKVEFTGTLSKNPASPFPTTNTLIFTLSPEYRPSSRKLINCTDDLLKNIRVEITTSGAVYARSAYGSNYINLSSLSYTI